MPCGATPQARGESRHHRSSMSVADRHRFGMKFPHLYAMAYGILAVSHGGRRRPGVRISMSATLHQVGTSPRVLLVIDQPVLAQYVALALNHGISLTQVAQNTKETLAAL